MQLFFLNNRLKIKQTKTIFARKYMTFRLHLLWKSWPEVNNFCGFKKTIKCIWYFVAPFQFIALYQCMNDNDWLDFYFCTTCLTHTLQCICNLFPISIDPDIAFKKHVFFLMDWCFWTEAVSKDIFRGFNKIVISSVCAFCLHEHWCVSCTPMSTKDDCLLDAYEARVWKMT